VARTANSSGYNFTLATTAQDAEHRPEVNRANGFTTIIKMKGQRHTIST